MGKCDLGHTRTVICMHKHEFSTKKAFVVNNYGKIEWVMASFGSPAFKDRDRNMRELNEAN